MFFGAFWQGFVFNSQSLPPTKKTESIKNALQKCTDYVAALV